MSTYSKNKTDKWSFKSGCFVLLRLGNMLMLFGKNQMMTGVLETTMSR